MVMVKGKHGVEVTARQRGGTMLLDCLHNCPACSKQTVLMTHQQLQVQLIVKRKQQKSQTKQLQVHLHICIPSHLSNMGVNCHTKFCQAKGIHRECACVTELFQMWRKTAKAKQRRAQKFAYLLML